MIDSEGLIELVINHQTDTVVPKVCGVCPNENTPECDECGIWGLCDQLAESIAKQMAELGESLVKEWLAEQEKTNG